MCVFTGIPIVREVDLSESKALTGYKRLVFLKSGNIFASEVWGTVWTPEGTLESDRRVSPGREGGIYAFKRALFRPMTPITFLSSSRNFVVVKVKVFGHVIEHGGSLRFAENVKRFGYRAEKAKIAGVVAYSEREADLLEDLLGDITFEVPIDIKASRSQEHAVSQRQKVLKMRAAPRKKNVFAAKK